MEGLKPYVIGGVAGLLGYLLNFVFTSMNSKTKELEADIKANTKETAILNGNIIELKAAVSNLTLQISPIAKLREDVNEAFKKIRTIETTKDF